MPHLKRASAIQSLTEGRPVGSVIWSCQILFSWVISQFKSVGNQLKNLNTLCGLKLIHLRAGATLEPHICDSDLA